MNSKNTTEYGSKTQDFDANSEKNRKPISDESVSFEQLEEIRARLALSRRQICLLLKVDASAWSRWSKSEAGAPLHIYQALNWYMQLVDAQPQVHASYGFEKKFQAKTRESEMQIYQLKKQLQELKAQSKQSQTENRVEEFAERIQESFENVILKMNSQVNPQKTMEIESLKYENRKFQDKILDLQTQMNKLLLKLDSLKVLKTPRVKRKTKVQAKAKRKSKKATKVQASSKARSVTRRKVLGKHKLNGRFINVGKRIRKKRRSRK